jgi:uncharacterized damage-inducible protein DinB
MNPVRIYDYLTQARAKLFDWVRPLDQEQYIREFPFGLKTLRATLLEMAAAEWLYSRRLGGSPTPPRAEWPINADRQPTFPALEAAWTAQQPGVRALIAGITDWQRQREWPSLVAPPDKKVTLSATLGDMVTQLFLHEVHHRAQAMAMLRQLGVQAQNLDYSIFMFTRREEPA